MRLTNVALILPAFVVGIVGFPAALDSSASAGKITELLSYKNVTNFDPLGRPTCGPVTGANVRGVCLDKDISCCSGFYTRGFCPGEPANVLCCTFIQRCSDNSGFCHDLNHVSCDQPYVKGLCPGPPINVQCCRGTSGNICNVGA